MPDEQRLPQGRGGSAVSRTAAGVHRTTGPWTPTVHAFLRHLERVGFDGAPRVLGFDDSGREILTFIEGEVLADPTWEPGQPTPWPEYAQSEDALVEAAALLRRLHDASSSFEPEAPVWKQHEHAELLPNEIVCHGDVGPHNTVYRHGVPVALIDWETIRPNHPLIEWGIAAWHYVPLGSDGYFSRSDFPSSPDLGRRLALFARAYGVRDATTVLWAVHQAKQRAVDSMRFWPIGPSEGAAYLRLVASDLEWFEGAKGSLLRHLATVGTTRDEG